MAKKAKAKAKPKTAKKLESPPPRTEKTEALITDAHLISLLKSDNSHKNQIDELVGSLREKIAHAVDKQHLDKGAYADMKRFYRLARKDAAKAKNRFATFLAYMDKAGVTEMMDEVQDLPFEKGEEQLDDGKVTPIGVAARKVAEAAGERVG